MSRFGDLLKGKSEAPAPAPKVEAAPAPKPVKEEPLAELSKDELEAIGRQHGVELDKRHSKKKLIQELKEIGE